MAETTRPFCQFNNCDALADYELTGRWTIFDWLEVYACLVHVPRAISWLRLRHVDGQPIMDIEQRTYDDWR